MPLHHAGHPLAQLVRRRAGAGPDGAGDVGRAVRILRAGVDQVDFVGVDRPVGRLRHPVMDDRAVLAGAGDGGEAFAAEPSHLRAQRQQRCRGGHLGLVARRDRGGEPVQEPAHRHRIARCAFRAPCCSTSFLHAFGQQARVGAGDHRGAGRRAASGRTTPGSRPDRPAPACRPARQRRASASRAATDDRVAEPRAGRVGQLGRRHEQLAAAVGVHQREAERERRERHVPAADVEQPGDRGGVGR